MTRPLTRMPPALLDINVLIALLDPSHQFHDLAHQWFSQNRRHGWATCPITENGCIRILSKPAYPATSLTPQELREVLATFAGDSHHLFWPDSVSLLDRKLFQLDGAGPKNLTDIYLLGLAQSRHGRFVTFDRTIRTSAVADYTSGQLVVLSST